MTLVACIGGGQLGRMLGLATHSPALVEVLMRATATDTPCPTPAAFTYTRLVLQPDGTFQTVTATHTCEGTRRNNGFYGDGIVNATRVARGF